MRLATRALIYLALPSVAFAWLLQVDFPVVPYEPLPLEAAFHYAGNTFERLLEAAEHVAIAAGMFAVLVALWSLFSVDS